RVAFADMGVLAQDHGADGVALEVEREPERVVREFQHLALHHVREAVDAADAVGDRHHRAPRAHLDAGIEVLDRGLDEFRDLGRIELHGGPYALSAVSSAASCARMDPSMTLSPSTMRTPAMTSCEISTVALTLRPVRCSSRCTSAESCA